MSINLNAASVRELTQLPRIAADKARKIVHYREVRKGFRDWDDVGRTPGSTSGPCTPRPRWPCGRPWARTPSITP